MLCSLLVFIGSCGLKGQHLAAIMTAISSNGHIADLTLDVSNNIIDSKTGNIYLLSQLSYLYLLLLECEVFCKTVSEARNLYSLSLRYFICILLTFSCIYVLFYREMEFGKIENDSLTQLINAIATNNYVREIDLSGNFKVLYYPKIKGLMLIYDSDKTKRKR